MAIPTGLRLIGVGFGARATRLPPDTDFGEPLSAEDVIAFVSGTRDGFAELCFETDLEGDLCAGRDRPRELNFHDGLVLRITVIGLNEVHCGGEIAHAFDFKLGHIVIGADLLFPLAAVVARASAPTNFTNET